MKMLEFPRSLAEIPRDYPVHKKGDWRGVIARFVGALLWLGRNLRRPALATAWVMGCATAIVVSIAATASAMIGPWWVVVPLLVLFSYPIALRAGMEEYAQRVWDRYTMHIAGRAYSNTLELDEDTEWHEGVHVFQRGVNRAHAIRYSCDPRGVRLPVLRDLLPWYRAHSEAQAYGLEVALGYETMSSASTKLAKRVYALDLTHQQAWDLLKPYVLQWREIIDG